VSTDLLKLWRAEGIAVDTYGRDWATWVRPGSFAPEGIVVHHTGDKGRGDSGLSILIFGRGQPNPLNGPLCNGSPRENGRMALISGGRANHAGMGSSEVLDRIRHDLAPLGNAADLGLVDDTLGNGLLYGLEVDNDGAGQPYPPEQLDTTIRACTALCRHHGWTANRVIGHKEWTRRKVDWSLPMPPLRAAVAHRLAHTNLVRGLWVFTDAPVHPAVKPQPVPAPVPAPVQEDDMQALMKTASDPAVFITDGVSKRHVTSQAELKVLITTGLVKGDITLVGPEVLAAIPTIRSS
jgi:hypothetical protein